MKKCLVVILSVVLYCGGGVCPGQDVAVPGMPDENTAEGRKLMAQGKAVARFMVLMLLGHAQVQAEMANAAAGNEKIRMEKELAAIPTKALEVCPKDVQTVIQDMIEASRKTGKSISELPREQQQMFGDRLGIVIDKYKRKGAMASIFSWVVATCSHPDGKFIIGEEILANIKALRHSVESGATEIPDFEPVVEERTDWVGENGGYADRFLCVVVLFSC